MSVSRRRFLHHGAFAAAACAASPLLHGWGGRQLPPDNLMPPSHAGGAALHGLSRESFTGLIGTAFKVSHSSGNADPVWLRLLAVHDLPSLAPVNVGGMAVPPPRTSSVASTTGYLLLFSGPGTQLLQETYTFEHDRLGKFAMFIVPGAPGQGSYAAVFNLLNAPINFSKPPGMDGGPTLKGAAASATPSSSNNASVSGNAGGSGAGRPAQEQMEPLLLDRQERKLPE